MRFFILIQTIIVGLFCLFFQSAYADSTPSFQELHVTPVLHRSIDSTSQIIIGSGAISVFLTEPNDNSVRRDWVKNQKMNKPLSSSGDILGSGAGGLLVMGGQYLFDLDETNWISHARGLVWSTVVVTALKYSFGRPRPGGSESHLSFPSGHTTTAFTTATTLTYAYGWKAAVVAYPLAAFVGLSRLADDAHWASDIVGGAFLGFWAARATYYSATEASSSSATNQFYPLFQNDGLGVGWTYVY